MRSLNLFGFVTFSFLCIETRKYFFGLISNFVRIFDFFACLVFFNTAGGDARYLMNQGMETLLAISAGSVFMGAMSYIGNAPNFMVKSIAEENNIKMPSFFGYMLWSICILSPILIIFSLIYF